MTYSSRIAPLITAGIGLVFTMASYFASRGERVCTETDECLNTNAGYVTVAGFSPFIVGALFLSMAISMYALLLGTRRAALHAAIITLTATIVSGYATWIEHDTSGEAPPLLLTITAVLAMSTVTFLYSAMRPGAADGRNESPPNDDSPPASS